MYYHTTTKDRLASIMDKGLLPNSLPSWFTSPAPYIMLSDKPWTNLNGDESMIIEVNDPAILPEHFTDLEGLRWPYPIKPCYLSIYKEDK